MFFYNKLISETLLFILLKWFYKITQTFKSFDMVQIFQKWKFTHNYVAKVYTSHSWIVSCREVINVFYYYPMLYSSNFAEIIEHLGRRIAWKWKYLSISITLLLLVPAKMAFNQSHKRAFFSKAVRKRIFYDKKT